MQKLENTERTGLDAPYNGWKNYPTWACYSWLTGGYVESKYWEWLARETERKMGGDARAYLIEAVKAYFERLEPDDFSGFHRDVFEWACGAIDYEEVVTALLEAVKY